MQELDVSTLKHYTIQSRLARGGMSTIYLARDEQQRAVAIKVVSSGNDEYAARFQHALDLTRWNGRSKPRCTSINRHAVRYDFINRGIRERQARVAAK